MRPRISRSFRLGADGMHMATIVSSRPQLRSREGTIYVHVSLSKMYYGGRGIACTLYTQAQAH